MRNEIWMFVLVVVTGWLGGFANGVKVGAGMKERKLKEAPEALEMVQKEFSKMIRRSREKRTAVVERIVNGDKAKSVEQFPQLVALMVVSGEKAAFLCTGSVVDTNLVLSAAHCTTSFSVDVPIFACVSTIDVFRDAGHCVTVTRFNYPTAVFNPKKSDDGFDLAILVTGSSLLVGGVRKVKLASQPPRDRTIAISVGFGTQQKPGTTSGTLNYVDTQVVANRRCKRLTSENKEGDEKLLCTDANYDVSFGSICSGDSGGPLLISGRETIQYGVASSSFSVGGACIDVVETIYMSTYSRDHRSWITASAEFFGGSVTYS